MKILEVTPFFSPVHGGSAEVPYQLCRELSKRGHQVTVYTSDFRLGPDYIGSIPLATVLPFKTRLSCASFTVTPDMVNRAREDLARFDIVHLHNYRTFQNMVAHHYAVRYGVPYVLQAHGSAATFFQKAWLKRTFDTFWGRGILNDASRLIAVTTAEAEQYQGLGASKDKTVIVPHGIDLSQFDHLPERGAFRKKYALGEGQRIVLFLGRLDRTKGVDLLVRAFASLSKEHKARLVIAGPDFGYLKTVRRLVHRLRVEEKVLFTGPLYGRDKLEAYVDADVCVLPSRYEIFGLTILEACACGTPVIISDRCGLADAVRGRAGLVIPGDVESLHSAIETMLNDDAARRKFGETGRRLVQDGFGWEQVAARVEKLYGEVVGQSERRG